MVYLEESTTLQQGCPNDSLTFDKPNSLTIDFSSKIGFLPKLICSIFFSEARSHEEGFVFSLCLARNGEQL